MLHSPYIFSPRRGDEKKQAEMVYLIISRSALHACAKRTSVAIDQTSRVNNFFLFAFSICHDHHYDIHFIIFFLSFLWDAYAGNNICISSAHAHTLSVLALPKINEKKVNANKKCLNLKLDLMEKQRKIFIIRFGYCSPLQCYCCRLFGILCSVCVSFFYRETKPIRFIFNIIHPHVLSRVFYHV